MSVTLRSDMTPAQRQLLQQRNQTAYLRKQHLFSPTSPPQSPWAQGRIPRDPRRPGEGGEEEDDGVEGGDEPEVRRDATAAGKGEARAETVEEAIRREQREEFERARERTMAREEREREERWKAVLDDADSVHSLGILNRKDLLPLHPRVFEMRGLRTMTLQGLELDILPDHAFAASAPTLERLVLSGNRLKALPRTLGMCVGLRTLNLSSNALEALPECVLHLTSLETLDLTCNRLKELPDAFGRCFQRLTTLDLDTNALTSLPDSIADMPQLSSLNLSSNEFTRVPSWIGARTPLLEKLIMARNRVDEFPTHIADAARLSMVVLSSNALAGKLPAELVACKHIAELHLAWNQIEELPLEVMEMENLMVLRLEGNPLKRPPLEEFLAHGGDVLAARRWARKKLADLERKRERAAYDMMLKILRLVEDEGLARAAIFTARLPMQFESGTAEYYCLDWEPFMSETWPIIRGLWRERRLSIPAEDKEEDVEGMLTTVQISGQTLTVGTAVAATGAAAAPPPTTSPAARRLGTLDPPGTFWSRAPTDLITMLLGTKDSTGPVVRRNVFGLFRDCICRDEEGRPRVCVPPRKEFACMRRCVAIKASFGGGGLRDALDTTELDEWTIKAAKEAEELARRLAKEWTESEEGREHFMELARRRAEEEDAETRRFEFEAAVEASFQGRRNALRRRHEQARTVLLKEHRERMEILRAREREIVKELEAFAASAEKDTDAVEYELKRMGGSGGGEMQRTIASHIHEELTTGSAKVHAALLHELGVLRVAMERGPSALEYQKATKAEAEDVAKLEAEVAATKQRYRPLPSFVVAIRRILFDTHRHIIQKHYDLAVDDFIEHRVRIARDASVASRGKFMSVAARWKAAGLRRFFMAWRTYTASVRGSRERVQDRQEEARKLEQGLEEAELKMKRIELEKWSAGDDPLSGRRYWVHADSGEVRWDEPTLDNVVPRHRTSSTTSASH